MKSYSFSKEDFDSGMCYRIWTVIQENKGYFYKYCKGNAEEAMSLTLIHALTHYDPSGNLKYYILALARDIIRTNGRFISVDFLDKTLEQSDEDLDTARPTVDVGSVKDFSTDIVEEMYLNIDRSDELITLALSSMEMFLLLCESLINRDSSSNYYSKSFITSCLALSKKIPNFNDKCIELYDEYGDRMRAFCEPREKKVWKEADYSMLSYSQSKQVILLDEYGFEIIDADQQNFQVAGALGTKRIIKVKYDNIWYRFCKYFDIEGITDVKFTIGDKFIIKTFGGSISIVNPDMGNIRDLLKYEIITNILCESGGKILNIGSECIYLLCSSLFEPARYKLSCGEIVLAGKEIDRNEISKYCRKR